MNAKQYIQFLRNTIGGQKIYRFYPDYGKEIRKLAQTSLFSNSDLIKMKENTDNLTIVEGLDLLVNNIGAALAEEFNYIGYPLVDVPLIAIVPTQDFNAVAMRAPNGEKICCLDILFHSFINSLSGMVAECIFAAGDGSIRDQKSAYFSLLGTLMHFCGIEGDLISDLQGQSDNVCVDPMKRFAMGQFSLGVLAFVIAHEFAHHALGHTGSRATFKMHNGNEVIEVTSFNRTQIQELDADKLGFNVFINYSRITDLHNSRRLTSQSEISPLLLLQFLSSVENFNTVDGFYNQHSFSHPPALMRLSMLRDEFMCRAHENAKVIYPYLHELFGSFKDFAVNILHSMNEANALIIKQQCPTSTKTGP